MQNSSEIKSEVLKRQYAYGESQNNKMTLVYILYITVNVCSQIMSQTVSFFMFLLNMKDRNKEPPQKI
jgi:hypothetical protein